MRFLALGIIIGASTVVLLTSREPSFGAVNVVQNAMPATSSTPAAVLSAIIPRNLLPPAASASPASPASIASALADPPRIPVIEAERLPKAETPAPGASSSKHAKGKKKGEPDADDRKGAAGPTPLDESSQLTPTIEQLLQGMQGNGFGKVFDDKPPATN